MHRRGLRLLAVAVLAVAALLAAHLFAAVAFIEANVEGFRFWLAAADAALAGLLILTLAWHLHRLTRERQRHAFVEILVETLSVPASIEGTAEATLELVIGAGLARGGIVAAVSGDDEAATRLVPLAVAGARRGWASEAGLSDRLANVVSVGREHTIDDPWLLGMELTIGRRPWVARIPILRGDERLGQLLLASRHRGWLGDRALLHTMGAILAAALDHARQYQVAYERSRDLEEQNARRREFLYAIAHELRAPLTSIQAFAKLLGTDQQLMNGNKELLLGSLARGVDRLATFVNDLLALGRIEDAGLRVEMQTFDVSEALRDAETILRPAFMARDQSLVLDLPDAPLEAFGDGRALEQIVLNLLSNANRFSPTNGAIVLRAHAVDARIRIEVQDSGPGIDLLDRQRIFEPFYRVHRNGAPEVPGSGLGLAVARRLTDMQGGHLWVEAVPGGTGSRFCVELRLPEAPAPGGAPAAEVDDAKEPSAPAG